MMKRILLVIAGAFFFALGFGPALIGAAIGMIALGWVAGILHLVLILLGGALLIIGLRRERPPEGVTTGKNILLVAAGIGGGILIGAGALAIADEVLFLINYHPALVGGALATLAGLVLATLAFIAGRSG